MPVRPQALVQRRTGTIQVAGINKCEGLQPDRSKLLPVVAQPGQLCSQFDQPIARRVEPSDDIVVRNARFAEFREYRCKGAGGTPFSPAIPGELFLQDPTKRFRDQRGYAGGRSVLLRLCLRD